jgi:acid phosphatase family membrane protein YuiD
MEHSKNIEGDRIMGDFFAQLWQNRVLLAAVAGWLIAQATKVVLVLILDRKFDVERFFGSGGMPSSHSATVCALCSSAGMAYGIGSFEFAVSFVLAFIVMYDACNVRLETGKQAIAIKEMHELLRRISEHPLSPQDTLKELVGHTFPQVIVGAVLGIAIGVGAMLL